MHRRLIQLAQTARLPLLIAIAGGLIAGACSVAQAHLLSTAVDRVFLDNSGLAGVWPWLQLLVGVIALRGVVLWGQEVAASEVAIRAQQELRGRLFGHILRLGPSFSRSQKTGELTTAAVDGIEALGAYYSQYLPQLVISVLVPLTILILVFPLDPLSGGILLVTAPLIPFFMYMIGRTAEKATARQYATLGRLSSHLLDSIQGLATLKIFGQSGAQVANVGQAADKFREVTLSVLRVSFMSAFALELIATISTAIIAVEVGLRLLYNRMAFQQALFLLILAPEFYAPLRLLGARFHAGKAGTAASRRILEVLDTPLATHGHADRLPEIGIADAAGSVEPQAISFKNVSFTYPGSELPALNQIDLTIAPGMHIAIVGASGAGKTTLAALLLGFILPTKGELGMGNTSPGGAGYGRAGALPGWVPQAPHIFHDTIAANIRLGRPNALEDEIWRAVCLAHLDEFIKSLPEGLETMVGEGGARLSSGEAQRLALARAFLLDAPTLVLDEPSSSLDPENEALLQDSLRHLGEGRTVITIAQRLNTVKAADEIVVLDGGRIVERGTHSGLMASGGKYSRLRATESIIHDESSSATEPLTAASPHIPQPGPSRTWWSDESEVLPPHGHAVLGRLLGFLDGSWAGVALSVVLATLTIGSSVALTGTAAWLISAAALHPSIAALQVAIVGVRLFGISRAVFRYFERLVTHGMTFRLLRNIRVWLYAHLEPLAPARLMDYHAGDLVDRAVADVETLENLYVRVLSPVLTAVLVGAAVSAFLTWQKAGEVALVLVAGFALAGMVVPMISMRAARAPGRRMNAHRSRLRIELVDGIQGLADIVAFGRAADRSGRVREIGDAYAGAQRAMARISGLQTGLSSVFVHLSMWSAILLWIPRISAGSASGLLLAPFTLVVLASFEAVAGLPQAAQLWPATVAAARRLFEIVSLPPPVAEVASGQIPRPDSHSRPEIPTPELEFVGVCFTFPGRSQPAIRDVTFSVEHGECVAVVGPSGAGKSTLAQLLLRFWEYGSGDILLQGSSLRSMLPDDVRAQIGYASQHPYIFDTSILENLRLARRGLKPGDLEEAAQKAAILHFIQSLPNGFETLLGEHGARLSAGERQRLGIARLVLKDARVIILDEPTANLDALNEARILDSLFNLVRGRTCLFITHRLRRMEHFDRILVMDHGSIRERGTHQRLMAAGGLYARLWTLQNGKEGERVAPLAIDT